MLHKKSLMGQVIFDKVVTTHTGIVLIVLILTAIKG